MVTLYRVRRAFRISVPIDFKTFFSRRRRVSRAIPRRYLRYTFSRLSRGYIYRIEGQHLRCFFRDNSSCGHTICFKIAPNVVPGRVNKLRYRKYLSGTSTWVQSAIFVCPRSFQSEPNSKIRSWRCSNSLAIGSYAELFSTIPGGIRLPKTVDREWCNPCWISWNLQFSGNLEGFVRISLVFR